MEKIFFLLLLCSSLLSCKTLDAIRDQRGQLGCVVTAIGFTGTYTASEASKNALFCSKELPPNFSFEYDNGMIKVSIKKDKSNE